MISNWLIHGDTHGNFSWMASFNLNEIYTPEKTAIIILGDAGFNYYLNRHDDSLKRKVNHMGYRFYCVRGNHEGRPQDISAPYELIYDDDVKGYIYMEEQYPNIRFFRDWGKYQLGSYRVAVIGGAYSVDKWWRLHKFNIYSKFDFGYNNPKKTGWFPNEQLSTDEMDACSDFFHGSTFDFVFTHTCPYSWRPTDLFLRGLDQSTVDTTMEKWMEELKYSFKWNIWLFGHYHADRIERPHVEQYYKDTQNLDEIADRWKTYDETGELPWYIPKGPNFYEN